MQYVKGTVAFFTVFYCAQIFAEYPDRPYQFIVASFAGETEKNLTRLVAEDISQNYSLPAAVLDMERAEVANHLSTASADGYTFGILSHDSLTIDLINGHSRYSQDSFQAVGLFLERPLILVTIADMPFHDLKGLARHGGPVPLHLAHFGHNRLSTRQATLLATKLGFKFEDGGAYARPDCSVLEQGDVEVIITTVALSRTCIKNGTAKAIVSLSENRLQQFPEIPTVNEHYPEIAVTFWSGLFVRDGSPGVALESIQSASVNALKDVGFKNDIAANGVIIHVKTAIESDIFIKEQFLRTSKILSH